MSGFVPILAISCLLNREHSVLVGSGGRVFARASGVAELGWGAHPNWIRRETIGELGLWAGALLPRAPCSPVLRSAFCVARSVTTILPGTAGIPRVDYFGPTKDQNADKTLLTARV